MKTSDSKDTHNSKKCSFELLTEIYVVESIEDVLARKMREEIDRRILMGFKNNFTENQKK